MSQTPPHSPLLGQLAGLERPPKSSKRPLLTERDRDRLRYRAQFVFGPRAVEEFSNWKQIWIRENACLTAHPDLNTAQAIHGNKSLTLLGYIIDPENAAATDSEIVSELLPQLCSGDERSNSPCCTDRLGGRWILIAHDGSRIRIFSDALGQRQLCYAAPAGSGGIWCASQPGILARVLSLDPDPAAQEYLSAELQAGEFEYWWPYDSSLYREIKQLIPNHYLDFLRGTPQRFWPDGKLKWMPIRRAVKEGARLIRGLMRSAAKRCPLQIMITAGWDSRLVLAATKDLTQDVRYLTFLREEFTPDSADVCVPRRLLEKLGRAQELLELPEEVDEEFLEIYLQNVAGAHRIWTPVAQALYQSCPPNTLRVTGVGAETIRKQFRTPEFLLTPEMFAQYGSARGQKFAIDAFARWLAALPNDLPVGKLDLYYWELKFGNGLAGGQIEWDITGSSAFTPYNCRALLATLLSINEEYRVPPAYELHRALIQELWPEALSEPVNPHKKVYREQPSVKSLAKRLLVRTHLLDYVPQSSIAVARKLL